MHYRRVEDVREPLGSRRLLTPPEDRDTPLQGAAGVGAARLSGSAHGARRWAAPRAASGEAPVTQADLKHLVDETLQKERSQAAGSPGVPVADREASAPGPAGAALLRCGCIRMAAAIFYDTVPPLRAS